MTVKEKIDDVLEQLRELKENITFSLDDLRNYTQDGDKEKAFKEIDRLLKISEGL